MSNSDKFEDVTKVHPTDLDADDGNLETEATQLRSDVNESATQVINVNTSITDENIAPPSLRRIESEHRRADSQRKETTLDRVSKVQRVGGNEDGTSPGILLPSDQHEVVVEERNSVERELATEKPIRPRTNTGPNQEVTAPIIEDPSEVKPRVEPTMTYVPREGEEPNSALERNRARSESLLQRIGVRAEPDTPQPLIVPASEKSDTVEIKEAGESSVKSYRNNALWIWAAIFGVLAVFLVVAATILFTRSN